MVNSTKSRQGKMLIKLLNLVDELPQHCSHIHMPLPHPLPPWPSLFFSWDLPFESIKMSLQSTHCRLGEEENLCCISSSWLGIRRWNNEMHWFDLSMLLTLARDCHSFYVQLAVVASFVSMWPAMLSLHNLWNTCASPQCRSYHELSYSHFFIW